MSRVVAIGEIIVDFVSTEPVPYVEARKFEKPEAKMMKDGGIELYVAVKTQMHSIACF